MQTEMSKKPTRNFKRKPTDMQSRMIEHTPALLLRIAAGSAVTHRRAAGVRRGSESHTAELPPLCPAPGSVTRKLRSDERRIHHLSPRSSSPWSFPVHEALGVNS